MATSHLIAGVLGGSAGVTALIASRYFPVLAPQGTLKPFVTYQVVSSSDDVAFSGDTGLRQRRVQVDCYGNTFNDALAVAEAVRAALQAASGTYNGFRLIELTHDNEQELYEEEARCFRVSTDYLISHD